MASTVRMDMKDSDAGTYCGNRSTMRCARPEWEGGSRSCSVRVVGGGTLHVCPS